MKHDTPLTRRAALRLLGAGAAVGAALCPVRVAAAGLERRIPSSGEMIPALGIGTWRVFEWAPRRPTARPSRRYSGASSSWRPRHRLLAHVRRRRKRGQATSEANWAYSTGFSSRPRCGPAGVRPAIAQMEQSLRRMRTRRVDLMQVHNLLDWQVHLRTLREWKAAGRIRYVGVTHYLSSAYDELERRAARRAARLRAGELLPGGAPSRSAASCPWRASAAWRCS